MNTQQALQQAFQFLNSGNLSAAAPVFERVLQQEPQNFAALNGRGFIALQQNRLPQSAADFQQSLVINPKQPFAHKMLGIVQGAMGQFDASMASFDAALALDAKDPEVYFNRATFRFQAGQVREALADLDAAIKYRGSYLEARSNRANLLMQLAEYALAEKDLDYLVSKAPNNADLWVALGLAKHKVGKTREAMQCNDRAMRLLPNQPDALLNNASILLDEREFDTALSWANKAVAASPQRPQAYYSQAKALAGLSEFESALSSYDQAINLQPGYIDALIGRALVNASLRRVADAMADYAAVLSIQPDYDEAVYNRSHLLLEQRIFESGWEGYEHRFSVLRFGDRMALDIPVWNGQALSSDMKLLVLGEQGLGDQILFASVLPDLIRQVPNVCLQLDPRLVPLFQRSFPGVEVTSKDKKPPSDVVAQICIGSLPQFFRKDAASFAQAQVPYLKADLVKTAAFRKALAPNGERIIGINWRSFRNKYANDKSIGLEDLGALFRLPNTTVVNLQYGDAKDEVRAAEKAGLHFNHAVSVDLTKDIDGVASLLDACDVIVSVSNSTAHIAGALGKPVLLMLPYRTGKLWYWSEAKGEGSLWYPTVTTFHQSAQGDWQGTIEEVVNSLKKA